MRQNPWNAVLHLGHTNGTVTLWSPNMTQPLVKQLCHVGPLQGGCRGRQLFCSRFNTHDLVLFNTSLCNPPALALDHTGKYMATSGMDGYVKVRSTHRALFL
jgi:U3 small nucleolar RNA-associated protein 7